MCRSGLWWERRSVGRWERREGAREAGARDCLQTPRVALPIPRSFAPTLPFRLDINHPHSTNSLVDMPRQSPLLAEQELEIMKIVWDMGQATVRDVYEQLRTRRQVAYTTVMTTMRILERKGHLKVSRADRAYVYRPARPRQRVLGEMVQEFVDRVFGGAAEPLIQHL